MKGKPSVLLVTETPPGTPNGFGVTLDTLFRNLRKWTKVIYTDADFLVTGRNRGYLFARVPNHCGRRYWLGFVSGKTPEWRGRLSHRWLRRTMNGLEPHLVYSFFHSFACLRFADWIAHNLGIPHIPHIADHCDAFTNDPEARKILIEAPQRIAIGENMRRHYEDRLGTPFEVFHNNPEEESFLPPLQVPASFTPDKPFILRFCGSIFANLHLEGVEDVIQAVRNLARRGIPIRIEFFGNLCPKDCLIDWLDGEIARHLGKVSPERRFTLIKDGHANLVPASFDPQRYIHYRLSIPTKLTETLASSRPTLVYGPSCMEAVRFCQKEGVGTVIAERSIKVLERTLHDFMTNYTAHAAKAERDAETIRRNHSATALRKRFHGVLENSLGQQRAA
jgi:glycosyltransferase involved in cell wall biosynthesis